MAASHRITWPHDKQDAHIIQDPMCRKAWLWALQERQGLDAFVCAAPSTESKITKGSNKMKTTVMAVLAALMFTSGTFAQQRATNATHKAPESKQAAKSVTFLGHRVGETLQAFRTIEEMSDDDVAALDENETLLQRPMDGAATTLNVSFVFEPTVKSGAVTAISVQPYDSNSSDLNGTLFKKQVHMLTEKYGKPTHAKMVTYQNGFGATWACPDIWWLLPDGTEIHAIEKIEGTSRAFFIQFDGLKYYEKQTKPVANPY